MYILVSKEHSNFADLHARELEAYYYDNSKHKGIYGVFLGKNSYSLKKLDESYENKLFTVVLLATESMFNKQVDVQVKIRKSSDVDKARMDYVKENIKPLKSNKVQEIVEEYVWNEERNTETWYGVVVESSDGGQTLDSRRTKESALKRAEEIIQHMKENKVGKKKVYLTELDYDRRRDVITTSELVNSKSKLLFSS